MDVWSLFFCGHLYSLLQMTTYTDEYTPNPSTPFEQLEVRAQWPCLAEVMSPSAVSWGNLWWVGHSVHSLSFLASTGPQESGQWEKHHRLLCPRGIRRGGALILQCLLGWGGVSPPQGQKASSWQGFPVPLGPLPLEA